MIVTGEYRKKKSQGHFVHHKSHLDWRVALVFCYLLLLPQVVNRDCMTRY